MSLYSFGFKYNSTYVPSLLFCSQINHVLIYSIHYIAGSTGIEWHLIFACHVFKMCDNLLCGCHICHTSQWRIWIRFDIFQTLIWIASWNIFKHLTDVQKFDFAIFSESPPKLPTTYILSFLHFDLVLNQFTWASLSNFVSLLTSLTVRRRAESQWNPMCSIWQHIKLCHLIWKWQILYLQAADTLANLVAHDWQYPHRLYTKTYWN